MLSSCAFWLRSSASAVNPEVDMMYGSDIWDTPSMSRFVKTHIPCWFIHTSRFQTRPNWEGLKTLHCALWINISIKFKTLKYSNGLFSLYCKPLGFFILPAYQWDESLKEQLSKNKRYTCVIWSSYYAFSRTPHVTTEWEHCLKNVLLFSHDKIPE